MRDTIKINYANAETYYFEISASKEQMAYEQTWKADYRLNLPKKSLVKIVVNVFWQKDKTYVPPEGNPAENVELKIYENKTNIIEDRSFLVVNGI